MYRVCHLTSAHGPEDVRIFVKECVSLASNGYEVYLVEQGDTYDKKGVHIIGVGTPPQSRLKRIFKTSYTVYRNALKVNADLYHLHDPELLPYALRLKRKGKKVIFDSHECYVEQIKTKPYMSKFFRALISKIYCIIETFVCKRIDAVVIPATISGNNFFLNRCKKSVIVSNASRLDEFYNKDAESFDNNNVCYIGGLSEDRGIEKIVKASYNANAKLLLVGSFRPSGFQDEIQKLPEYECVEYLGQMHHDEIPNVLSRSMVGLCVLRDSGQYLKIDTFGIKVFEYMSMGLPVILSHSTYNDQMVKKYKFGICVNPEDVEEISSAIVYLLKHPDERRKMGNNGKTAIRDTFNWSVEEKKLCSLYKELLSS